MKGAANQPPRHAFQTRNYFKGAVFLCTKVFPPTTKCKSHFLFRDYGVFSTWTFTSSDGQWGNASTVTLQQTLLCYTSPQASNKPLPLSQRHWAEWRGWGYPACLKRSCNFSKAWALQCLLCFCFCWGLRTTLMTVLSDNFLKKKIKSD